MDRISNVSFSGLALVFAKRSSVQFPLSKRHSFQPIGSRLRLVVQGIKCFLDALDHLTSNLTVLRIKTVKVINWKTWSKKLSTEKDVDRWRVIFNFYLKRCLWDERLNSRHLWPESDSWNFFFVVFFSGWLQRLAKIVRHQRRPVQRRERKQDLTLTVKSVNI